MRRMHRTLGVSAAIFVVFMVASGIAINHSQGLQLDQRHFSQPFLLNWYGIEGPEDIHSFGLDGNWLSLAGSGAYYNGRYLSDLSNGVGAVFNGQLLVVAGSRELLIVDQDGVLVEKMPWAYAESGLIESIGLLGSGTVLVKSGMKAWVTDNQLLQWLEIDPAINHPAWSTSAKEPAEIREAIVQHYQGSGLSMERLLLDLHSGRIFGRVGTLVYDGLALVVGFLAISGLVLWIRGRKNGRKRSPKS